MSAAVIDISTRGLLNRFMEQCENPDRARPLVMVMGKVFQHRYRTWPGAEWRLCSTEWEEKPDVCTCGAYRLVWGWGS